MRTIDVARPRREYSMASAQALTIDVDTACTVSALLQAPPGARVCYVLAHGAGAGMTHPFMRDIANEFAAQGVATLRYQFPYMERGSRRPDVPALAHATVRAAAATAARLMPAAMLVAGGKSFGGRMTSQAQAALPLPGVKGLVFLGFPLHPVGEPSTKRGEHLASVHVPMLFVQGTRDRLADLALLRPLIDGLGGQATLALIADADHSFHVAARSGRSDIDVLKEMVRFVVSWSAALT